MQFHCSGKAVSFLLRSSASQLPTFIGCYFLLRGMSGPSSEREFITTLADLTARPEASYPTHKFHHNNAFKGFVFLYFMNYDMTTHARIPVFPERIGSDGLARILEEFASCMGADISLPARRSITSKGLREDKTQIIIDQGYSLIFKRFGGGTKVSIKFHSANDPTKAKAPSFYKNVARIYS